MSKIKKEEVEKVEETFEFVHNDGKVTYAVNGATYSNLSADNDGIFIILSPAECRELESIHCTVSEDSNDYDEQTENHYFKDLFSQALWFYENVKEERRVAEKKKKEKIVTKEKTVT